jgi:hypothetical protein
MKTAIEFCGNLAVLVDLKDWKGIERAVTERDLEAKKEGMKIAAKEIMCVKGENCDEDVCDRRDHAKEILSAAEKLTA